MKALIAVITALVAAPALAHPGHLVGAAGHDHWGAGIAIGLAVGIGLWAALKGKGKAEEAAEEETEEGADDAPQEA